MKVIVVVVCAAQRCKKKYAYHIILLFFFFFKNKSKNVMQYRIFHLYDCDILYILSYILYITYTSNLCPCLRTDLFFFFFFRSLIIHRLRFCPPSVVVCHKNKKKKSAETSVPGALVVFFCTGALSPGD